MVPDGAGEFLLTRIDADGDAWGHDSSGAAICVRGAVPGDVVLAVGVPQRKQRRRAFEVVRESSARRASPCPVQQRCGGCRLMPLNADAEQRVKLELLRTELLNRGVHSPPLGWEPSPLRLGYRNRIRLRLVNGAFQFFNSNKEQACSVLDEGLRAALDELRALGPRPPLAAFSHAEVRGPDLDGRPALSLTARGVIAPQSLAELAVELPRFVIGVAGDPAIPSQRRRLGELDVLVPLDAFVQVNDAVNQRLVAHTVETLRACGVASALDLFAGAGNFSLPLAAAGLAVTAVELHAPSVAALNESAARAGFACEGISRAADIAVLELRAGQRHFDCVLVDAPRAGAAGLLRHLAELGARFVVLCSCYAPSFARDLATLSSCGFRLRTITVWDMFPGTHHLESVALLERS